MTTTYTKSKSKFQRHKFKSWSTVIGGPHAVTREIFDQAVGDADEKVIVLVGCTQHGKSSLIRAILDYGGLHEEAKAVKVGSFGNRSTTKEPKSFHCQIGLKSHNLKSEEGDIVNIGYGDREPDDLQIPGCYTPISEPRSQKVRLRIIDTPGLDDSDNAAEEEKRTAERGYDAANGRVVDESHKFKVFKEIAAAGSIHAVCFVLDLNNNLGDALQKIYKEYMRVFELLGLSASYHFAHTKVTVDELFGQKARTRPTNVEKAFPLAGVSTKHHFIGFMDPDVQKRDPITHHFANVGIAQLLEGFQKEKRQHVTDIKYPKTIHNLWDQALGDSYQVLKSDANSDITKLRKEVADHKDSLETLERRVEVEKSHWKTLDEKYDAIDNCDLVEIGSIRRYERAHLFNTNRLYFDISAKCPIRSWDTDNCCDSYWYEVGLKYGEKSGYARLYGRGKNRSVQGTVTLKGWKCDAEADELKRLGNERSEALNDWKSTESSIEGHQSRLKIKEAKIEGLLKTISTWDKSRSGLKINHIPFQQLKSNGEYFGCPSIIAYAFGLGISEKVSIYLFSSGVWAGRTIMEKYREEEENMQAQLQVCKDTVQVIKKDREQVDTLLSRLRDVLAEIEKEIQRCREEINNLQPWTMQTGIRNSTDDDEPEQEDSTIVASCHDLEDRADRGLQLHESILVDRAVALETRQKVYQSAESGILARQQQNTELNQKWEREVLDREAGTAASKAMVKLGAMRELPIAAFTVVRQSGGESVFTAEKAWKRLYYELKDVYVCNPGRWDDVLYSFT